MESHAGLAAKDSDSEGTDLRRPEVDVPQRTGSEGVQGTRAPRDEGEEEASSPQQVMMAEINESMKMLVAILKIL